MNILFETDIGNELNKDVGKVRKELERCSKEISKELEEYFAKKF